jgi:hypothetical protein
VASEQDAARDRVLAARAAFAGELESLAASGRATVDIPARIRQSPAKAAAIAGGIAFVVLRGPQRLFGAARRAIFGTPAPMPKSMLPKEIDKTLKSLGDDGDKVRGTIERDFAEYLMRTRRYRRGLRALVLFGIARPVLERGLRRGVEYLMSPSPEGYATRLDEARARAGAKVDDARAAAERSAAEARAAAKERVDRARAAGPDGADEEPPTGV